MIRTNSGTSGISEGGIQVIDQHFNLTDETPLGRYVTDTDDVEIW